MTGYAAPGNITELSQAQLQGWSEALSKQFDDGIGTAQGELDPPATEAWFYNPISDGGGSPSAKDITWTAFPKLISDEMATPRAAWKFAENDRDTQSEYCEWETLRDPKQGNKVIRVTFSSETLDYYTYLADVAKDELLGLYQKHVSQQVQLADLFTNDQYNTRNRWNWPQAAGAHGAFMHMAQRNNTLGAAVTLAAVATWPRVDGKGRPITQEQPLIACAQFGVAGRHSDPHIGAQVNALVRAGNKVSLADPAGLYIDSIDTTSWQTPDGSSPDELIRIVRPDVGGRSGIGTADLALRVIVEAPPTSKFVLGDVSIDGDLIEFGGQIAEKMLIRLRGLARSGASAAPSLTCGGQLQHLPIGITAAVPTALSPLASRLPQVVNLKSPE
jgi:hypothetical protein